MQRKLLYKKNFPKNPILKQLEQQKSADEFNAFHAQFPSLTEMLDHLEQSTTYIPRPYRIRNRKRFINAAIDFSEFYGIDVKIEQFKDHICASFYFDCGGAIRNTKTLLGMGDELAFFTNLQGSEVCMCVSYYTHHTVRNGQIVSP